jgi:putative FmdB family regulatory protein
MPLYEYLCLDCGRTSEILVMAGDPRPVCSACSGPNLQKLLSAHAPHPAAAGTRLPGPGDTACCGERPGHAGCAGLGSCCGRH